jgi:hypothetical protein
MSELRSPIRERTDIPVVGDVDHCLLAFITDKLHLVLGRQHTLGRPLALLARRVPDPHLDGAGVSLLAILAEVLEEQGVAAMALDGVRSVKHTLPPARWAAVQRIGPIVAGQMNLLAIQVVDNAVLDAVGDPTDRRAVMRGVVLNIVVLRREAQYDVGAADAEFLDDGAQGDEGEFGELGGGGHGGRWWR